MVWDGMKRPWDSIFYWEVRRLPFNIAALLAATVSFAIVSVAAIKGLLDWGEYVYAIAGLVIFYPWNVYVVAAFNLLYSLTWITELVWCWGDPTRTEAVRPKVYRLGIISVVVVNLLPAMVALLAAIQALFHWIIRGFK